MWSTLASLGSSVIQGGVLGNWDGGWSTYSANQSLSKQNLKRAIQLQTWQASQLPKLSRQGLESAGYNPLLAIGSASPSIGGTVPPGSPSSGGSRVSLLDGLNTAADIKLKGAQTERTLSDAYVPVRYSRAEASHFGASLLGKLGINLGTNNAESFTLLYNPITKDLVNPITMYSTNTGHANSAEDVKNQPVVDVKMDAWKPRGDSNFRKIVDTPRLGSRGGMY